MKLSHLSAVIYGLSSSTKSSAYTNIQRRGLHQTLPMIETWKPRKILNPFVHSRFLQPSLLALHNNDPSSRHHYHVRRNHHRHFFSFSTIDNDQVRLHCIANNHQPWRRTNYQRQMVSLFSTTGEAEHSAATETTDADEFASQQKNETETTVSMSPALRLFYNDVYEVKLPPKHRFPMWKYRKVRERVQDKLANSSLEGVEFDFEVSPLATFEELSTTHDPNYITRFLKGDQTKQEQRNVGFPWSPAGVDRALSSVGGTLAAACFVCDRLRQQQQLLSSNESLSSSPPPHFSPSWAAHIAGGTHHAFYDYGEGFSVFSDMAVAANVVLNRYPDVIQNNILMIDLDVHQGNGNAVLFQSHGRNSRDGNDEKEEEKQDYSDRVFTFSMHCSGNYFSEKQDSDLDIELPIDCQDQAYLMTLNHWLKRFRAEHHKAHDNKDSSNAGEQSQQQKDQRKSMNYKWDLIIFQAGVDVLDDDRLGRMSLSPSAVARRNELVYEFASDLGVPLVICMGGGYPKRDDSWESIIETHSDVYSGAHSFLSRWSTSNKESRK